MKKKPTKKDIELVVSNIIRNMEMLNERVNALDNVFGAYIKHKKDEKGFQKYMKKQIELANDKRDK